ncbi:uncharacterized protein [Triticum aestivum]|uniref:uncharacterized protein isoform X1 n=1 Tax=Triticum aestivum TaxID=4565 RepID=UPI000843A74C|nr:uncharacterized protein LOC123138192 isoform X1 [Triticum aestivum]
MIELCDETGEQPDMNPGALFIRLPANVLPWAALALFHNSHREAYDDNDVKVTYVLFCCTAVLEYFCRFFSTNHISSKAQRQVHSSSRTPDGDWAVQFVRWALDLSARTKLENAQWRGSEVPPFQWQRTILSKLQWARKKVALSLQWARKKVAPSITELRNFMIIGALKDSLIGQYALVGFFVHNKKHTKMTSILSFLNCNDFFYQHWFMKPCNSSFAITGLVLKYGKKGWEDQIKDVGSYWKFNDRRGQCTLQANKCDQDLGWSLRSPFDESALLWHIATDFCFYHLGASADHQCATAQCIEDASGEGHGCAVWCERSHHHGRAVRCREMSNYLMYLLFVNPEMLLSGSRRNLLITANAELEEILKDDDPSLEKILKGSGGATVICVGGPKLIGIGRTIKILLLRPDCTLI